MAIDESIRWNTILDVDSITVYSIYGNWNILEANTLFPVKRLPQNWDLAQRVFDWVPIFH